MNTYTNTEEMKKDAALFTPGAGITITGYVDSTGKSMTIKGVLLDRSAYRNMQVESLNKLQALTPDDLGRVKGVDQAAATIAAAAICTSIQGSLDMTNAERKAPNYEPLADGSNLNSDNGGGCLYILRVKSDTQVVKDMLPKGDVPRSKALLGQHLDLPTLHYIHALKFAEGKFEKVELSAKA